MPTSLRRFDNKVMDLISRILDFQCQLKNTHHRSGPNFRPNEHQHQPSTKIVGIWQKCGNRTTYLFSTFLRDFIKQFYIKYSRRGALSVIVRIKKVRGGVGGGGGGWEREDICLCFIFVLFQIKIERSAKDSGSTFAYESCALTRNSCIRLLPDLSA